MCMEFEKKKGWGDMQHKPSNVGSCVKPLVMSQPASVCVRESMQVQCLCTC